MTDDELLAALGALAHEEAEEDPLDSMWDDLAAGALCDEDRWTLEAMAAADPALADALEAFEPRDAALDDRIAAAIRATLPAPAAPEIAETSATVIPFPWRRVIAVGLPLLAAAAAVFLLMRPPVEALPDYTLHAAGGEKIVRGEEPATAAVYGPGSSLDLVVRPADDVDEPVGLAVFVRVGDTLSVVPARTPVSDSGVFRLRGDVDALLPTTPGPQTLLLVVAPADAVPKSVDALRAGLKQSPPPWQVLEYSYQRVSSR